MSYIRSVHRLLVALLACSAPASPPPGNVAVPAPAKPASIAVQLAYKGTFFIGPPFSQVPPFTLLDDGTLILAEQGKPVTTARLSRGQIENVLADLDKLGFAKLESHPEHCKKVSNDRSLCVSDDSYTILRVIQPSGTLREVVTYSDFSNEPEILKSIVAYFDKVEHPPTTPYRPAVAALHVQRQSSTPPANCRAVEPALLRIEPDTTIWGRKIEGKELDAFLAIVGKNQGSAFVCADKAVYQLTLLPGVPGSDLDAELEIYTRKPSDDD